MKKKSEKEIELEREDIANYYGQRFEEINPDDDIEEYCHPKLIAGLDGQRIDYIKGKDFLEQC